MKKYSAFIILILLTFACKTIDEDWYTPEWITDKIEVLESDCYYAGSSINSYVLDSVNYIEIYIPNHLWPIENIFYENGSQVISEGDTVFSYHYFENNRGEVIQNIWTFPDDLGCPE